MPDWTTAPLGRLASFTKGRKVETGTHPETGFLPYLGASAISGTISEYADPRGAIVAADHDILMLWDGERSGLVGKGQPGVVSSTTMRIRPQSKVIGPYLYYALSNQFEWIQNRRTGTGVPHVPKDLGRILHIAFPVSQDEQRKISTILSILESAIEQTEVLIAKFQQLKAGLADEAFARGMDAKGSLRSLQHKAPDLYKASSVGPIPAGWSVETIGDLTIGSVIGPFGSNLIATDYRASGVPVVFVRDVKENSFDWKSDVFVSAAKARELSAHDVRPGDVVATKMGLPPCVAAVFPDSMHPGIVTADIVRLRVAPAKIRPHWLAAYMNSWAVRKRVEQITAGVTRPKVTLKDVRTLEIAVPSLAEQDIILARLDAAAYKISVEENALKKLQLQKAGLMRDLIQAMCG
jgi:type I restriction enzyme, S subunit